MAGDPPVLFFYWQTVLSVTKGWCAYGCMVPRRSSDRSPPLYVAGENYCCTAAMGTRYTPSSACQLALLVMLFNGWSPSIVLTRGHPVVLAGLTDLTPVVTFECMKRVPVLCAKACVCEPEPEPATPACLIRQADVWSAGIILFTMLAGHPPMEKATTSDWWFRALSVSACLAGSENATPAENGNGLTSRGVWRFWRRDYFFSQTTRFFLVFCYKPPVEHSF